MSDQPFPWPLGKAPQFTAHRVNVPPEIDGDLTKQCWIDAPRTNRFVDLVSGTETMYDTRAAVLWDEDNLYVAFWVEEPNVTATLTERDSLIYEDNDVELFIAGDSCYYELEINAFGTIYEVFFVWDDAYESNGFSEIPEFDKNAPGALAFNGVGYAEHPRGPRTGFWNWDFPGLSSAVAVDGTINDDTSQDGGWTVEIALPWKGMEQLAGGRSLPPVAGDVWRMSFSRFNQYKEQPPADDSSGWATAAHGIWDSHIPELFPSVTFSDDPVDPKEQ